MGLKKNSPLIAVRVGVLCFYTFFRNSKFFLFSGYHMELHWKGSQFLFFFGSWQWFSAFLVSGYAMQLHSKVHFFQNCKILWRFCNFFVFSFYRMAFLSKGSDFLEKFHQICWFSGCDFHLPGAPGARKPLGILQGPKKSSENYEFWNKSWDFLKIL